jgi:hypothetical protein
MEGKEEGVPQVVRAGVAGGMALDELDEQRRDQLALLARGADRVLRQASACAR